MRRLIALGLIGLVVPVLLWFTVVRPFASILPPTAPLRPVSLRPDLQTILDLRFNDLSGRLPGWEEKIFKPKTFYEVRLDADGEGMLSARSANASSALYCRMDVPIGLAPVLVWRWKAPVFPSNKKTMDLASKEDNDFAGRVYVIFKSRSMFSADVIEYVWDDRFPEGTISASPWSEHIKVVVVQSGVPDTDGWIIERRDVIRDYTAFFGKPPKRNIAALAIMSDSDNTQSQSGILIKHIGLETADKATKEGGAS